MLTISLFLSFATPVALIASWASGKERTLRGFIKYMTENHIKKIPLLSAVVISPLTVMLIYGIFFGFEGRGVLPPLAILGGMAYGVLAYPKIIQNMGKIVYFQKVAVIFVLVIIAVLLN